MFPKKNRADRKVIKEIFEKGKFISVDNLTFKFFLDKKFNLPRISFIVPKTITKSAVTRNLLRRRGYRALENYLNKFPKNLNGVFIFGNKSTKLFGNKKDNTTLVLEEDIKKILNKLKIT